MDDDDKYVSAQRTAQALYAIIGTAKQTGHKVVLFSRSRNRLTAVFAAQNRERRRRRR
jgi:hypothetical protein